MVLTAALGCLLAGCGSGSENRDSGKIVTKTFVDLADSYVRASDPTTNYGQNAELFVDGSPIVRTYLSFQPFGVSSGIRRATLRLYSLSPSAEGFQVRASAGGWTESGLTFNNAPRVGRLLNLSGSLPRDQWISIDVTSFARRHPRAVQLALVALGPTAISLASRYSPKRAPRLVIEYHPPSASR